MAISQTATWIGAIRRSHPKLSLLAVEILLLIADGADSCREIKARMVGTIDPANLNRQLGALTGRARWDRGRWVETPFQLVVTRPHPHISGALHYSLSIEGQTLIKALQ
jgi:hypothetical protein